MPSFPVSLVSSASAPSLSTSIALGCFPLPLELSRTEARNFLVAVFWLLEEGNVSSISLGALSAPLPPPPLSPEEAKARFFEGDLSESFLSFEATPLIMVLSQGRKIGSKNDELRSSKSRR